MARVPYELKNCSNNIFKQKMKIHFTKKCNGKAHNQASKIV